MTNYFIGSVQVGKQQVFLLGNEEQLYGGGVTWILHFFNFKMNYQKIYDSIIEKRKLREPKGYTELHHIIPRSLGGSNKKDNLVKLTAREHFLVHWLLLKIHQNNLPFYRKMLLAFKMMLVCDTLGRDKHRHSSRLYEKLKIQFSQVMSFNQLGEKNSQFGTIWISNPITQKSKKIKSTDKLPQDWIIGRHKIKTFDCYNCVICNEIHYKKNTKTCSKKCAAIIKSKIGLNKKSPTPTKAFLDDTGKRWEHLKQCAVSKNLCIGTIQYYLKRGKYKYL